MLMRRNRDFNTAASIVAVLDIGSSKVCCLIAAVAPDTGRDSGTGAGSSQAPPFAVLGLGHQRSRGIEAANMIDPESAQDAVRAAVSQAEQLARIELDHAHLAVNCGSPRSRTFQGHIGLASGTVEPHDINALESGARRYVGRDGGAVIAFQRLGYRLDATSVVSDPRGMAGRRLYADHHAVLVDDGPLRNIAALVESCHLRLAGTIPAAVASALATTTAQERALGLTCIDIGAGVTSIAAFANGHLVFTDTIQAGGQQITDDIGRALSVPLAEAERIKTLYATLAPSISDQSIYAGFPFAEQDGAGIDATAKSVIAQIVRQRTSSLLSRILERLEYGGVVKPAGDRLVITGGASQMPGLGSFATGLLERSVRIAAPPPVRGWASGVPGPAFSCLLGLASAVTSPHLWAAGVTAGEPVRSGYLGRMERWLRDSF